MKIFNPSKSFLQSVVCPFDTLFIIRVKPFDLGLSHLHQSQFEAYN